MYTASTASVFGPNLRSLATRCCRPRHYSSSTAAASAASNKRKLPFKIPEPIERSPTALLEALAGTVKEDETAAPFHYIDDPQTIPTSSAQRRMYAMSKEFGRRTARRLVEEWPTLFMFDRDKPELNVFRPQKALDPSVVEPNEENLRKMMTDRRVTDAVKMYERIREHNRKLDESVKEKKIEPGEAAEHKIKLSEAVKLDLFRLLCYYNAEDVPLTELEEWHMIRSFYSGTEDRTAQNQWKKEGLAEELFDELPKTDELYSTLICGLAKFRTTYSQERTQKLYKEMSDASNGFLPHEEVFNGMLAGQIPLHRGKTFNALEWLREMGARGIRPSIRTFNSALRSLCTFETNPVQKDSSEQKQPNEPKAEPENAQQNAAEHNAVPEQLEESQSSGSIPQESSGTNLLQIQTEAMAQQQRWEQATQIIREMLRHGVEPSLTTYYMTMNLVTDEKMMAGLLDETLGRLEQRVSSQRPIERVEETDSFFFLHAMRWAASFLANERLVDRLVDVYKSEQNRVRFERHDDQNKFFTDFLYFKFSVLPLDAFYVVYKTHVPHQLGLSMGLLAVIMRTMAQKKPAEFCWPLLRRMAEDAISSTFISSPRMAYYILRDLTDVKPRHLNETDRGEYFALCNRVIEVVEKLDQRDVEREALLVKQQQLERQRQEGLAQQAKRKELLQKKKERK